MGSVLQSLFRCVEDVAPYKLTFALPLVGRGLAPAVTKTMLLCFSPSPARGFASCTISQRARLTTCRIFATLLYLLQRENGASGKPQSDEVSGEKSDYIKLVSLLLEHLIHHGRNARGPPVSLRLGHAAALTATGSHSLPRRRLESGKQVTNCSLSGSEERRAKNEGLCPWSRCGSVTPRL